ncbi:MAG: metallophosphoesterase [Gemmatimonadales bacterium]|jgi:3',5'-cyclic AMP phosphodiesterase CpdA|nr:MAG: metallophosphoesterase [Gemmatimonadales bacterium]
MITLVHGSDIHFGKPHLPHVADAFRDAVQAAEPAAVVISGDLTQRAKVQEYRAAAEYLELLDQAAGGAPIVVTPGNHDVPLYRVAERLLRPYQNYQRFIRRELNTVTRIPGMTLVALNSAAPRRAIVNGRIREAQLEFARDAFQAAPEEDVKVLVSHHHLAPAPDYEGDTPLPRAREILEALKAMGVELVLGGHLHRGYIVNSLDVYPGEDRDHGVVVVHSGTTTSARGRARERLKNSFNVVRVASDHLDITHHIFHPEEAAFLPLSRHLFPRRPFLSLAAGIADLDEELVAVPSSQEAAGREGGR